MEQARPDSTLLPAAQIEAQAHDDGSRERDERIAQLLTARPTSPLPEPGSAEAKAAFKAACHEHTIRTQFANEYPELERTATEWWTADSLGKALETGDLTPAECARLYPLATERELRMAQIEHELNLGGLHALAFAEHYPVATDERDPVPAAVEFGPDRTIAELAAEFCRAYRTHGEFDRAMMAGDITEEEWLPHHEAVMALAGRLAATEPTTMIGMALKCLGPIGLLAWDAGINDDPAQLSPHERVAADFQAANRAGSLASILPDHSSEGTLTECQADRAWAVTQAAAIDLSGLTILELNNLYDRFNGVADGWLAVSSQPWARASADGQCHVSTAGGRIADCEQDRAGEIRNRIAGEIRQRVPADDLERNMRLETLIQFELLCEISLKHNPELRAEIAQAWGA